MIIEIKGTGSHNKGAEMMLLTILQELENTTKNLKFTIAPHPSMCKYSWYSNLGLFPKIWYRYKGFQFGFIGKFIPKKIRELFGMVTDEEVDIILDASGFNYSDQWGENVSKIMAQEAIKWKRKGKKIILMPQAFGPFKNENIRSYMQTILENSDLVYARDEYSFKKLNEISNERNTIKLAPDFTMLLNGEVPDYFDTELHQVCIVPNMRMIDKGKNGELYYNFLIKSIEYIQNNGLNPFFLIHGGKEDLLLTKKINDKLETPLTIIDEDNPVLIKGIIKKSLGFIGSRFHGIASALYSGTVAIGTGWSHKYEYLYESFDFQEGLIDLDILDNELFNRLDLIIKPQFREKLEKKFLEKELIQRIKAKDMFEEIKNCIK